MTFWLKAHKFSYKKPKGLLFKHNQQEQEEFKKAYQKLKKTTSDPIIFMDSVHPTMATKKAYGCILNGARRALRESGSRTRVNIIGAINIESRDVLHHTYETINTTSVIYFLKLLVVKYQNEGKNLKQFISHYMTKSPFS
jgi:hypothetical protein